MALLAGSNLGPYRIMESVGRGGMASVFKAYEASLDRYVALKVLPPEFLHDPTFAERFRREAQTVARLEHPQIIPIFAYDIDTATGTPWMAMRLISGGSLSQRIKRGRMAPTESARILKDVADALDYAHSQGVIHRDVKPQNVLLDDAGRVYLADFGIAKMVESSAHLTQTGMITGTPQYMAPEQALGKSIDKSIDIYALGIVAYELFTGRVPFSADTPIAVLMKQASEPMPLPSVNEVQEEVTRAILRATAKDPVARWPTATAFAKAVSDATISVGSTMATSAMPSLSAETVQGMTAPSMTAGTKKLDPAAMMAAPRPAAGS
ncbi:MAG: serine/threonine-protein kinase, partial [Vicinamibacteria bacterium]